MIKVQESKVVTEKNFKNKDNNHIINVFKSRIVKFFAVPIFKREYDESLRIVHASKKDEEKLAGEKKSTPGFGLGR